MDVREDPDAELHRRLSAALGREAVLTAPADRSAYALDALRQSMLPSVVVLPRSPAEVATAVRIAASFEQPIIVRGVGTSMTGASAPIGGGMVISTVRMNRILEIDSRRRRARVQPGIRTLDLSYAAAPHGLFFAPDPATEEISTIGGNLGTDAAGPHAFAYGRTSEQILALEYVDARGEIEHTAIDDGAFDVCSLFAGSEGTLGIVTELSVRLRPAPESIRVGLASFHDIESAIEASTALRERCGAVVALELLDEIALTAVTAVLDSPYPPQAKAVILVEFAGLREETYESEQRAQILIERYAADGWISARSVHEARQLWMGRREVRRALSRVSADIEVHDVAVPRSRMLPLVRAIGAISQRHRLRTALVGHVGDGGIHPIVLYDRSDARQRQSAFLMGNEILETAVTLGGGPGEYGIGTARRALAYSRHNAAERELFWRLRRVFDIDSSLNPEKCLPFAASENS